MLGYCSLIEQDTFGIATTGTCDECYCDSNGPDPCECYGEPCDCDNSPGPD